MACVERRSIRLAHVDSKGKELMLIRAFMTSCGAGGGIRTHEPLRDRVLSPARSSHLDPGPLTWLGNPRAIFHSGRCHIYLLSVRETLGIQFSQTLRHLAGESLFSQGNYIRGMPYFWTRFRFTRFINDSSFKANSNLNSEVSASRKSA
jgi:hypothetical protein